MQAPYSGFGPRPAPVFLALGKDCCVVAEPDTLSSSVLGHLFDWDKLPTTGVAAFLQPPWALVLTVDLQMRRVGELL